MLKKRDYYSPFGLSINALSSSAPLSKPNRFKYNGKELDIDFDINWYDYGARNYDPQIGRFNQIDPAADVYLSSTPYHYVLNNPIMHIDPTGMLTELFNENGDKIGEDENGVDGNVSIVSNKEGRKIRKRLKNEGEGALVTQAEIEGGVQTTKAVLEESLDVLARTEGTTTKDTEGGLHEESSLVMKDGTVVKGPSGDKQKIFKLDAGGYTAQGKATPPNIPKGKTADDVQALIHSHPTKTQTKDGVSFTHSAKIPTMGKHADEGQFAKYSQNVIVGRISSSAMGAVFFNNKAKQQGVVSRDAIKKILGKN